MNSWNAGRSVDAPLRHHESQAGHGIARRWRNGWRGAVLFLTCGAVPAAPFPYGLEEVCTWSDDGPDLCYHRFTIDRITDCGNPQSLTAYEAGGGLMILHMDPYPNVVLRYSARGYNRAPSGFGDRLSVVAYVGPDGWNWDGGFGDGAEDCDLAVR